MEAHSLFSAVLIAPRGLRHRRCPKSGPKDSDHSSSQLCCTYCALLTTPLAHAEIALDSDWIHFALEGSTEFDPTHLAEATAVDATRFDLIGCNVACDSLSATRHDEKFWLLAGSSGLGEVI